MVFYKGPTTWTIKKNYLKCRQLCAIWWCWWITLIMNILVRARWHHYWKPWIIKIGRLIVHYYLKYLRFCNCDMNKVTFMDGIFLCSSFAWGWMAQLFWNLFKFSKVCFVFKCVLLWCFFALDLTRMFPSNKLNT